MARVCASLSPNPVPGGKGRTIRSLSFHSFRHGAATAVFKNAALKDFARRVTAHSSRGVVDRYIHQDIEAIRQATNLIPRLQRWKLCGALKVYRGFRCNVPQLQERSNMPVQKCQASVSDVGNHGFCDACINRARSDSEDGGVSWASYPAALPTLLHQLQTWCTSRSSIF